MFMTSLEDFFFFSIFFFFFFSFYKMFTANRRKNTFVKAPGQSRAELLPGFGGSERSDHPVGELEQ